MTEKYPNAPECPFCGSAELHDDYWVINDDEVDAICCLLCYAGAPASVWCGRRACGALPDSVQEALNSGDGSYRP